MGWTLLRRIREAVSALSTGAVRLVRQSRGDHPPRTSSTETPAEPSTPETRGETSSSAEIPVEQSARTEIVTYRLCYRGFTNEVGWRTATTFDPATVTEGALRSALESLDTIDPPPGHYALFPIDEMKRMRPALWRTDIQGDMETWQQRYDRERKREQRRRANEQLHEMGLSLPEYPASGDEWDELITFPDDDHSTDSLSQSLTLPDSEEQPASSDALDVFRE